MDIVRYLVEEKKVRPANDVRYGRVVYNFPSNFLRVLHMALMAKNDPKEMFLYHIKHGANINAYELI
jgi:hypothetical protein